MADDTLTHKDLAALAGVSETTIKSYRKKFPEFIPVQSKGKPIRFPARAGDVVLRIRDCFQRDLSVEETRDSLAQDFPILDDAALRTLPPPKQTQGGVQFSAADFAPLTTAVSALAQGLADMRGEQVKTNAQLIELQEIFSTFLTLHVGREDTFTLGVERLTEAWESRMEQMERSLELLGRSLSAVQPIAASAAQDAKKKRVVITNTYGDATEYILQSAPMADAESMPSPEHDTAEAPGKEQEPPLASTPDSDFLQRPLVVKSEHGEFLGVAGKIQGAFSLADFLALMDKSFKPPHAFAHDWERRGQDWVLNVEQPSAIRPKTYRLELTPAATPLGNDVALLTALRVNGVESPPPNLYAFIREMKSMQKSDDR